MRNRYSINPFLHQNYDIYYYHVQEIYRNLGKRGNKAARHKTRGVNRALVAWSPGGPGAGGAPVAVRLGDSWEHKGADTQIVLFCSICCDGCGMTML